MNWILRALGVVLFLWGILFLKGVTARDSEDLTWFEHFCLSGLISVGVVSWLSLVLFLIH